MNFLSPPLSTEHRVRNIGRLSADRLAEVAGEYGYRIALGDKNDGWNTFRSMSVQGEIALGLFSDAGPYILCVSLQKVTNRIDFYEILPTPAGYSKAYMFDSRDKLFNGVKRVYQESQLLDEQYSNAFEEFAERTGYLGHTERETKARYRIGQAIFRNSLLEFWNFECPLTSITDIELLRASHIIPWSECATDQDRLCVYNGLLLSTLWDAAFDKFLVTFSEEGETVFSKRLTSKARHNLSNAENSKICLQTEHQEWMRWHRDKFREIDTQ